MSKSEKQKRIRRAMRELVTTAYERELRQSLAEIEAHFKMWRAGAIDSFRLNELIHEYHNGAARELWKKYGLHAEMLLPSLVVNGVIAESEVPEELLAEMHKTLQAMRAFQQRFPEALETSDESE